MSTYDRHELKIIRRGISIDKVIAAYKHFCSYRKAAKACGIDKDTVKAVLLRYGVTPLRAELPSKASYNPLNHYSDFAKWHKAHADDPDLPYSLSAIAKLSGTSLNVVKCYFYRRRKAAREILDSLPDLRRLAVEMKDIEGEVFKTSSLKRYRYAIHRYSQSAVLQGEIPALGEVTALIPSIDRFASRVRKFSASGGADQAERKTR